MPPSRTTLAVIDDSAGQPLLWADINSSAAIQNDVLTAPSGRRGLSPEVSTKAPAPIECLAESWKQRVFARRGAPPNAAGVPAAPMLLLFPAERPAMSVPGVAVAVAWPWRGREGPAGPHRNPSLQYSTIDWQPPVARAPLRRCACPPPTTPASQHRLH